MSDEKFGQINKILGSLGTLERTTEFRTFLLLGCLTFAVNISLGIFHQTSLSEVTWQYARNNLSIGHLLIFFTGFTFYMSFLIGVLRYIADGIVGIIIYSCPSAFFFLFRKKRQYQLPDRPTEMVRPYELLRAARNDDGGYLEQYNKHKEKKNLNKKEEWKTASLSFGLLLLIILDTKLPETGSISHGFYKFLNSFHSELGILVSTIVLVSLLVVWLFRFIDDDYDRDWIVCPQLYSKLEEERRKKEEQQREEIRLLRR